MDPLFAAFQGQFLMAKILTTNSRPLNILPGKGAGLRSLLKVLGIMDEYLSLIIPENTGVHG